MGRAFDEDEKQRVRKTIIDAGTELFGRRGFDKTSIDEIVGRSRVAKGTFYSFWRSKEEFYFTCLEEAEMTFQYEIIQPLLASSFHPADALGKILVEAFDRAEEYPIIKRSFDPNFIRRLYRKLPREILDAHTGRDRREFADIISRWDSKEFDPGINSEVFDGLFKGLLMMSLHKEIIGEDVYEEVVSTMGTIFSEGLKALSERRRNHGRKNDH